MTATTMQHRIATIIDDMFLDGPDAAARAILAALPGMVPDLVWDEALTVGYTKNVTQMSGQYWIGGRLGGPWVVTGCRYFVGCTFPTIEDAKAAANAHNRAAIAKAAGWTT
jgi:hypothetical protein